MSASMTPHGSPTQRFLADERKESAVAFLGRALVWFARYGVSVERVMTDNGNCYRSHLFRQACNDAGIRHLRTKPCLQSEH